MVFREARQIVFQRGESSSGREIGSGSKLGKNILFVKAFKKLFRTGTDFLQK